MLTLFMKQRKSRYGGKDLYMKGICIQGGVENANKRVYPVGEITNCRQYHQRANKRTAIAFLGEVDHPDDLKINLRSSITYD